MNRLKWNAIACLIAGSRTTNSVLTVVNVQWIFIPVITVACNVDVLVRVAVDMKFYIHMLIHRFQVDIHE